MAAILYVSGVMHQESCFAMLTVLGFAKTGIAQMGTLAQAVHQQSFNLTAHRCIVAAV